MSMTMEENKEESTMRRRETTECGGERGFKGLRENDEKRERDWRKWGRNKGGEMKHLTLRSNQQLAFDVTLLIN
jgi:hypothetical protein